MKFCITLPESIQFNLPNLPEVDFSTYYRVNLYEYLYYLYCKFHLFNRGTETLIPSFYSNYIQQIISTNCQVTDENSFLNNCNLANFRIIIKRISEKIKLDETINSEIFSRSIFIIGSCRFSLDERDFLEFLLANNPSNIYYLVDFSWKLLKSDFNVTNELIIIDDEKCDKKEVANLFLSYLAIIVNPRDQLRFCQIFNIPERKLNHQAFTALRHESEQKDLSMSQIAFSYVIRLKLGGASYAPSSDCPLNKYVYGLSELVDAIDKIQKISEDGYMNPDKVAVIRKMLCSIKSILLQDKTKRFKKKQVEYILEKIMENIQKILSKDYIQVLNESSSHVCQIRNIIKSLLADYAIQPESYFNQQAIFNLGTPVLYNTPKGGCSKNLSYLYMSPDTFDSPILSKHPVKKSDIIETESMPAWPLHGEYQSDLHWIKHDLTPPHIVQQISKDRLKHLAIPNLNEEVSNDDLFNNIDQIAIAPFQHKISIPSTENLLTNDRKSKFPDKRNENLKPLSTVKKNEKKRNSSGKTADAKNGKRSSLSNAENKPARKSNKNKPNKRASLPSNQKLITSFFSV